MKGEGNAKGEVGWECEWEWRRERLQEGRRFISDVCLY